MSSWVRTAVVVIISLFVLGLGFALFSGLGEREEANDDELAWCQSDPHEPLMMDKVVEDLYREFGRDIRDRKDTTLPAEVQEAVGRWVFKVQYFWGDVDWFRTDEGRAAVDTVSNWLAATPEGRRACKAAIDRVMRHIL